MSVRERLLHLVVICIIYMFYENLQIAVRSRGKDYLVSFSL